MIWESMCKDNIQDLLFHNAYNTGEVAQEK